jgi:hypothetical protein
MSTSEIAQNIACCTSEAVECLLQANLAAYFEVTGSPGLPPLAALKGRLVRNDKDGVSSFSVDGVTVLRVDYAVSGVKQLYSFVSGGDPGEA